MPSDIVVVNVLWGLLIFLLIRRVYWYVAALRSSSEVEERRRMNKLTDWKSYFLIIVGLLITYFYPDS